MKNFTLIIVFSVLTLLSCKRALVPTEGGKPIAVGLRSGIISSNICGDEASSFKALVGFMAGGVAEIPLNNNISVQPEVLYATQGAKYEDSYFEGTYKLSYINAPILAKYYVLDGLSVEAGPQVGILLSAKDEFKSDEGSDEVDVKDQTKSVAVSAVVGVGYKLQNGINFGLRYNLGLSRIDDFGDMPLEGNDGVKWKNHVMQLHLGFMF